MLYNADCIEVLKTIEPSSIDLIFADPPYFLSNGGKSIKSGQIVSVNKGAWDDKKKIIPITLNSLLIGLISVIKY